MVCLPDNLTVRLEGATEGIKDSTFAFDKVFGPQSSQADVFAEVSDMVQSALDGYKVDCHLCCLLLLLPIPPAYRCCLLLLLPIPPAYRCCLLLRLPIPHPHRCCLCSL